MIRIIISSILLFFACSLSAESLQQFYHLSATKNIYSDELILDMVNIPQSSRALQSVFSSSVKAGFNDYYKKYFTPWTTTKNFDPEILQKELSKRPKRYAENYQIVTDEHFDKLENNANIAAISSLKRKAITIDNTFMRVLPTNSYMFGDPYSAGEGYPFDYAQDDYLNIGEPLLISHYTKDGRFAYVLTSTGSCGFVLAEDIVEVNKKYIQQFRTNLVMLKENTGARFTSNSPGTVQLYIGTILPLSGKNMLLPIRNSKGEADFEAVSVNPATYINKPLSFSKKNVGKVVDTLINQPYGWGGNLFHMDCARLVRNYFAIFGIHMPLLSKQQSTVGKVIDISTLNNQAKKQTIIRKAVPYQSILYMPGHIGIYMGTHKGEPIMLNALWGIKLFDEDEREYRYVVGKSIISTLSPGGDLYGFSPTKSDILSKITVASNLY